MGAAETTMEARLAATMASLSESRALLASCSRRLGLQEQEREATMTTSLLAPDPVSEKPVTKPWSSSLISTHRDLAVGALRVDAILAPTMPTSCSAEGLAHYTDNGHAELVFPTSGSTHLPAATSTLARNNTLQYMGEAGVNTPTGYSTHVLTWPRDIPGARARDIGTDMSSEVLTHVGEIPELSITRARETRRLGQNLEMWPEDIFSMGLNEQLSLQFTQLATQIWDPGIPRFACTAWFCCYVILLRRCSLHALLRRTSEILTETSETCHAFLANNSLITTTTSTLEQALVLQIHDYQAVNNITWYMEVPACLMQLLAAQLGKNQPELGSVRLPPFWGDILLGYYWELLGIQIKPIQLSGLDTSRPTPDTQGWQVLWQEQSLRIQCGGGLEVLRCCRSLFGSFLSASNCSHLERRQLLVFHNIHNGQDFFPLAISANTLQYRPWDPGVHSTVCAGQ